MLVQSGGALLLQSTLENLSLALGALLLQSVLENLSFAPQRALENLSFALGALLLQSASENLSPAPSKRHLCPPEQIYQLPVAADGLVCPGNNCVLASSTSTRWRHCPSCAGFCCITKPLGTHRCCRAGPFLGMSRASIALASLPSMRWRSRSVTLVS